MNVTTFAFLGGAGKIGSAIIRGLIESHRLQPRQIVATARHTHSFVPLRKLRVRCTTHNRAAVRTAQVVVLCVHPDEVGDLLGEVGPLLTPRHLVISVVSGCGTQRIEQCCAKPLRVILAMPNTPVMVRESMTCLAQGTHASRKDLELARKVFAPVGAVLVIDERHMHAATGLGGCGPAFAFKIIEALSEGGIKMGLPRDAARTMAAQVLKGAAQLMLITGQHPAHLKDEVTTPGGCSIDGLAKLEERGLSIALIDAVEAATKKVGRLIPT